MRWKSDTFKSWGQHLSAQMTLSRPSRLHGLLDAFKEQPGPALGGLRSYGDAALKSGGQGHLMTRMDRFLSFDTETGILTAEAGITMRDILDVTLPKGWGPSALPGTGFATLGGCIAMDVHGKDHRTAGNFSAQVLSLDLLKPDGKTQTLSRDKNKRLFFATLGGLGQTGIISQATLQLHEATQNVRVKKQSFENLEEGMALLEANDARFAVAWIDALATGLQLGRGVLETSDYTEGDPKARSQSVKSVPFTAPKFAMSKWPVKLFNRFRYRRYLSRPSENARFVDVQYPLDQVLGWNRLYGKDGFHQFQACFPLSKSDAAMRALCEKISASQAASPLVVMKRLGPSGESLLGFPQEGFTLAVDFQHRKEAAKLLSELHDITRAHEGRVYLAKDSAAKPQDVEIGYSAGIAEWQDLVLKADPKKSMITDLVQRLELRS